MSTRKRLQPEKRGGLAVVYRPLTALTPWHANARVHSPSQIGKLKASLLQFGWANPILIADGVIVAGHGRLQAATELAAEGASIPHLADQGTAPTIDLSHLNETERRAYVIADNRLAEEATWDADLLTAELAQLSADGFNIDVTGFTEADILGNGAGLQDGFEQEQQTPPLANAMAIVGPYRSKVTVAQMASWLAQIRAEGQDDKDRICAIILKRLGFA